MDPLRRATLSANAMWRDDNASRNLGMTMQIVEPGNSAFSMIINESLVARTFGTYTLQLFDAGEQEWLVPVLAVGLIASAFLVNLAGNKYIGAVSKITAILKVGGILAFAAAALWASGFSFEAATTESSDYSFTGFLAGVALAILAYKGFTTITNSGDEVKNPERNVGRAIMI